MRPIIRQKYTIATMYDMPIFGVLVSWLVLRFRFQHHPMMTLTKFEEKDTA